MNAKASWVTKTNLTDWLRCPYAFWLYDTGQITPVDKVSPVQMEVIQIGIEFEKRIVADAPPIPMPPGGEAEIFAEDHTLVAVRGFENSELRLKGRPDGLVTSFGALEPVEIKAHGQVQRSGLSWPSTGCRSPHTGPVPSTRQGGSFCDSQTVLTAGNEFFSQPS